MTSTVEIIKTLLKDELAFEVLRTVSKEDYILENLFKAMPSYSKTKIAIAVDYLDSVALTDNVFTRSGSFYRISARGVRVLEIAEESFIEENENG